MEVGWTFQIGQQCDSMQRQQQQGLGRQRNVAAIKINILTPIQYKCKTNIILQQTIATDSEQG